MFRNLQAEQARAGLTNQAVADRLGMCRPTYEYKKKNGNFYVIECIALCKLFNVDFEYLFAVDDKSV